MTNAIERTKIQYHYCQKWDGFGFPSRFSLVWFFFFNAYCLFDVGQNFWAFTDDVRRGSRKVVLCLSCLHSRDDRTTSSEISLLPWNFPLPELDPKSRKNRDKQDKYRWAKRSQRLSGVSLLRSPIFFPFFPQCRAWSQAKTSQKVILFFPHGKFVFYFFKAIFHSISRYLRQSFGKWNWFVRTANAGFRDETWQSWTQTLNRPLCPCKWHTAVVFYLLSNRIFRKLCLW